MSGTWHPTRIETKIKTFVGILQYSMTLSDENRLLPCKKDVGRLNASIKVNGIFSSDCKN